MQAGGAGRQVAQAREGDELDLGAVREQIDAVDEKIHLLLNARAQLAQRVGISKREDGRLIDFYRPEREAEVLRRA
jgi:chorismate mutase / prephenate dehydratase